MRIHRLQWVLIGAISAWIVGTTITDNAMAACDPPSVTTNPANQSVCADTSVALAATASGSPAPTVQWQVSTNAGASFFNVAGATSTQFIFTADSPIPVTGPVFLILMENHNWSSFHGSSSAPYLNNILLPMASRAEQYYNPPSLHPSLPNYLWLEAGSNFGILDDNPPSSNHQSTTNHLVTQLKNAGIPWRAYQENISGTACPLTDSYPYAVRHDPFVYFDDVTANQNPNSAYCIANVVPYTQLTGDLASNTVARYNFITPNVCDDGHDTCTPLNDPVRQTDNWLSNNIPQMLSSQAYTSGGAIIITWDEGEGGDGPIGLIVLSSAAKGAGYNNTVHYTHSSTLRTMQEILGVGPLLGDAANATDLGDLFNAPGPSQNGNQYRAVFSNSCGSATSSVATLTVSAPPAITNQPANEIGCIGQSAQFSAGVAGAGPLTYQWRKVWGAGWQFRTSGSGSGGFFIGSSTGNDGGDPGADGDINTSGGNAWGMYANGGFLSEAVRPFNGTMATGQTFKINMDNGYINNATQNGGTVGAGSVGFGLRDAGETNRFEFYFTGGDSQYRIHDSTGSARATGISFTGQGLHLEFTLTGVNSYSLTVSAVGSDGPAGVPVTLTGTLTGTAGTSVDRLRLFNYSAGTGSSQDGFFNSISIGTKSDNASDPAYSAGWINGQDGGATTIVNGGEFSGATTATLTINPIGASDDGSYNLLVSGACNATTISGAATLTVLPASMCAFLMITSPPDLSESTNGTITVTGMAAAAAGVTGVTVNGTSATSGDGFTNWTATVSGFTPCTNTLTAVATDGVGGTQTNTSRIIYATGSFDCNGDGLADAWQILYFGCVTCSQAGPTADPDHDGFNNLQEFQDGSNPTDPLSSPFQITAIVQQGNDMLLTWTTTGGTTNVVQATGGAGGDYATNFVAVSPAIIIPGQNLTSTNYLDSGGATNAPSRYYRIAMVTPVATSSGATQAVDNAAASAYASGWANGSNGGTGFGPWTLTGSGVLGSSSNGYFVGVSTNNAFVTSPGIDVGGKSWGIYANGNNFTAAYRALSASLPVGGTFKIDMDNGFIDTGGRDGFVLRNGNANASYTNYQTGARFEFVYIGGDSSNSYKVVDNAGQHNIGVGFTGTGLHLVFTLNTTDTYTLRVINNASGATNAVVNGTLGGTAGSTLDSIALYDRNAGAGSTKDAFFNSLLIIGP